MSELIRLAILGAPVARPLDLAEAFLAADLQASRSDCEERGAWRVFVFECVRGGNELRLSVSIAPRTGAAGAFTEILGESDAGIVLVGAGGWREQEGALAAIASARRAVPTMPLVHVINEFVPPRLEQDPEAAELPALLAADHVLRGRICWWRHEKSGTELARAAVDAALGLARARGS